MEKIIRKQMLEGLYDLQADPNNRAALIQVLDNSYEDYKGGMSFEDYQAAEQQMLALEDVYSDQTAANGEAVAAIINLLENTNNGSSGRNAR